MIPFGKIESKIKVERERRRVPISVLIPYSFPKTARPKRYIGIERKRMMRPSSIVFPVLSSMTW